MRETYDGDQGTEVGVGMCIAKALNYEGHWCTCLAVLEDAVQGLPNTWELNFVDGSFIIKLATLLKKFDSLSPVLECFFSSKISLKCTSMEQLSNGSAAKLSFLTYITLPFT